MEHRLTQIDQKLVQINQAAEGDNKFDMLRGQLMKHIKIVEQIQQTAVQDQGKLNEIEGKMVKLNSDIM